MTGSASNHEFQAGPTDGNVVLVAMRRMNVNTLGLAGYDMPKTVASAVPVGQTVLKAYVFDPVADVTDVSGAAAHFSALLIDANDQYFVEFTAADGTAKVVPAVVNGETRKIAYDSADSSGVLPVGDPLPIPVISAYAPNTVGNLVSYIDQATGSQGYATVDNGVYTGVVLMFDGTVVPTGEPVPLNVEQVDLRAQASRDLAELNRLGRAQNA
ncbi:hypothetical protein [Kitasatospora sp. NPDC089509]|uniref:hypothetical protein n=1 Tax=Kitasatospora sp. NPDC089509 TaxID=3364079 RepID=UPI003810A0AA